MESNAIDTIRCAPAQAGAHEEEAALSFWTPAFAGAQLMPNPNGEELQAPTSDFSL